MGTEEAEERLMSPGILRVSRMNVKRCGIKLWSRVKLLPPELSNCDNREISTYKDVPALASSYQRGQNSSELGILTPLISFECVCVCV